MSSLAVNPLYAKFRGQKHFRHMGSTETYRRLVWTTSRQMDLKYSVPR